MFLTIVFAILFVWFIFRVAQRVYRKLHDPIGRARRIIESEVKRRQEEEAKNV